MSFFEFPYTRTYSSDLGWLIRHVKWLTDEVENKTIKYADPINWNITSQYEKNTVVLDGTVAYLSKEAVPSGVAITNTDYWQPIFDIAPIVGDIGNLREQISTHYESSYTSTHNYNEGEWLFINNGTDDLLYYTLTPILINGGLVPDVTVKKATVEDLVQACVASISAIESDMGDIANLTTPDTSSVVNAINSIQAEFDALKSSIYVNVKDYGAVGDGVADDTQAINDAKAVAESYEHGATLFFPAGVYKISSTITFNHVGSDLMGISLLGEGNYSSIITSDNDISLISYEGDDTIPGYNGYIYGVSVENIYLYKSNVQTSNEPAIKFIYCGMVNMINVRIRYFKVGLYLSGCSNSSFYKVNISSNKDQAIGIDTGDRSVSNSFIACTFSASGDAASLAANSYGFNAERGNISDQNIIYFDVADATAAIRINGVNTVSNQTGDINIIDLVCETWYGIMLYNMAAHGNVNIIGGWFNCKNDTPRYGVYITNCNGVSIDGSIFVNNIGSGSVNGKTAIGLADANSGTIMIKNCLMKNQNAFNGTSGGGAVMFNNNFIHYEGSINSSDNCVVINAKNSIACGNLFRGICKRYILLGSAALYSLCANNVSTGQATNTAYENQAGATTVLDNNVDGN